MCNFKIPFGNKLYSGGHYSKKHYIKTLYIKKKILYDGFYKILVALFVLRYELLACLKTFSVKSFKALNSKKKQYSAKNQKLLKFVYDFKYSHIVDIVNYNFCISVSRLVEWNARPIVDVESE